MNSDGKTLRVALISSHSGLNGAVKVVETLVRGLADVGLEVRLYHRPGAWLAKQGLDEVADLRAVDMGVRWLNQRSLRQVRKELLSWDPIVLHSHGTTADRFASCVRVPDRLRTVSTAHARIIHMHWRRHDMVIAPSTYTAQWYRRWRMVRDEKLRVVITGVPDPLDRLPVTCTAAFRHERGLRDGDFVIAMLGHISANKNQSSAIPLLVELHRRGLRAHIVMIGAPDKSELSRIKKQASVACLEPFVHLIGLRSDALTILRECNCFLSTSRDEQGPIAMVEALALGLPVVATPVGWGADMLGGSQWGVLIDPSRAHLAAESIVSFAMNPIELQERRAAARRFYEERFTCVPYINHMLDAYWVARSS